MPDDKAEANERVRPSCAPTDWGGSVGAGLVALRTAFLLTCIACGLFTTLASGAMLASALAGRVPATGRFVVILTVKTLFFVVVAALSAWGLKRWGKLSAPAADADVLTERSVRHWRFSLLVPLAFAALLVFPRLDAYPWPAPDETFHLTMARNLAVYGQYASGRPETGFVPFDPYASVGPTVLVPIALAFKLFGVSLVAARVVMGLYFLALCTAAYAFLRGRFGDASAGVGIVLLTGSFGSVYLARSLYGEVPALFYAVTGLLLWERALEDRKTGLWATLAGAALALALLSKLFFVISLMPLCAVLLLDRFHLRRISPRHVVFPAISFFAVWGGWMVVQTVFAAPDAGGAAENAALHMHYLLFGFDSLPATAGWLLRQPVTLAASAAALLFMFARIARQPLPHAHWAMFLMVPFFVYWWLFFTTGLHARYMYYACAIAGMASGPFLVALVCEAAEQRRAAILRVFLLLAVIACLVPPAVRTWEQVRMVYLGTEARDDIAAAHYVGLLPEDARIATTYWPLSRTLDFLTDRPIEMLRELPQDMREYDAVIVDQHTQQELLQNRAWSRSIGRYAVLDTMNE